MAKNQSVLTNLSQVEKKLLETGAKFLRLTTLEGSVIVPFNQMGKPWKPRYNEIVRKIPTLPDGVYIFQAQDTLSPGAYSHKIVYGKGNFEPLTEAPSQAVQVKSETPLLSVETAVENVRKSSEALAENSYLKKEVEALKAEIERLKTELQAVEYLEDEEETEEEENPGMNWLKETIPALLPLADRYFDLEEKKLNFQREKHLSKNGTGTQGKGKPKLPPIGSPQFNEMVEEISGLSDKDFEIVMKKLQTQAPAHYRAILPLVWEEEENQSTLR